MGIVTIGISCRFWIILGNWMPYSLRYKPNSPAGSMVVWKIWGKRKGSRRRKVRVLKDPNPSKPAFTSAPTPTKQTNKTNTSSQYPLYPQSNTKPSSPYLAQKTSPAPKSTPIGPSTSTKTGTKRTETNSNNLKITPSSCVALIKSNTSSPRDSSMILLTKFNDILYYCLPGLIRIVLFIVKQRFYHHIVQMFYLPSIFTLTHTLPYT